MSDDLGNNLRLRTILRQKQSFVLVLNGFLLGSRLGRA